MIRADSLGVERHVRNVEVEGSIPSRSISRKHYTEKRYNFVMKVFNGKKAANDYMSAHTLAFSTPELTLMRYSFWLGDMVKDPEGKEESIPRLYTYVDEEDYAPVQIIDDDKFEATGALFKSNLYGSANDDSSEEEQFCSECGSKISPQAKFCRDCGVNLS